MPTVTIFCDCKRTAILTTVIVFGLWRYCFVVIGFLFFFFASCLRARKTLIRRPLDEEHGMFECLNHWWFECSNVLNVWRSDCVNDWLFWMFECLNTWRFACLIVWMRECAEWLNAWMLWMFNCLQCWMFGMFGGLRVWMFESLRTRAGGCLNALNDWMVECIERWNG